MESAEILGMFMIKETNWNNLILYHVFISAIDQEIYLIKNNF